MRIRVIQKPTQASIDGISLEQFQPGLEYDVGNLIGAFLLAEGWAEPVPSDAPAVLIPFSESTQDPTKDLPGPPNLVREIFPSYYDAPAALAADRRRKRRARHQR